MLGSPARAAPAPNGVPHSLQNFAPDTVGMPHDGHTEASREPHSGQNFAPGALAVPQVGQLTVVLPCRLDEPVA